MKRGSFIQDGIVIVSWYPTHKKIPGGSHFATPGISIFLVSCLIAL